MFQSRTDQRGTRWVLFWQIGNYLSGWQPQKIFCKAQEAVLLSWFSIPQNAIFFFLKNLQRSCHQINLPPLQEMLSSCIWQLHKTSCSSMAQSSQQLSMINQLLYDCPEPEPRAFKYWQGRSRWVLLCVCPCHTCSGDAGGCLGAEGFHLAAAAKVYPAAKPPWQGGQLSKKQNEA